MTRVARFRGKFVKGLFASLLTTAVVALGVVYLGEDLWAVAGGSEDASFETAAGTAPTALPVDGPAVNHLRYVAQQTASNNVPADDGVLVLDNWNFTQSSTSPFVFSAPNGFDFFNPLFTFNFSNNQAVTNNFFFGSGGFGAGVFSPFGFPSTPTTGFPGFAPTGGSFVTLPIGATPGNSFLPFLNGARLFVTVETATVIFPVTLGNAGFAHRHVFSPVIVIINITVIIVSPSS